MMESNDLQADQHAARLALKRAMTAWKRVHSTSVTAGRAVAALLNRCLRASWNDWQEAVQAGCFSLLICSRAYLVAKFTGTKVFLYCLSGLLASFLCREAALRFHPVW